MKTKVQKLGLYEGKTQYKNQCEEFSDIFTEFTKIPLKREIGHRVELLDSSKPPPKPS